MSSSRVSRILALASLVPRSPRATSQRAEKSPSKWIPGPRLCRLQLSPQKALSLSSVMTGGQALPSIQPWFSRSQPWLSRSQTCACTRSLGRTSRRRGLEKLPEPHLYWTERNASCFPLFQDHHSSSLSAKVRSLVHPAGHRALPSSPWLTQNATSGASSGAAHACPLLGSSLSEGWGVGCFCGKGQG